MLFWLIAASLTLIVTVCVVAPLFRRGPGEAVARARHDAEVYRAQLAELDVDEVDMLTVVVVGSSNTRAFTSGEGRRFAYTPRGYAAKPGTRLTPASTEDAV